MILSPFLIMLREGLEAALIVSIIASYLRQTGRAQWLPAIWVGVLLAIAVSLLAGTALQLISAEFPQKAQELFEALVGLIAVIVLTSMVFWMKKAARSIGDDLRGSVDQAFANAGGGSHGAVWSLVALAFFAVAREGLESIFFLLAIFQQSTGPAPALSALAGVGVAVLLGLALYYGGIRINFRLFFRWTGVFILIVAAGLVASVLRNLHEAGVWNLLQHRLYDLTEILPMTSVPGAILSGLFNYHDAPAVGEALAYVVFLAVTLVLFFRPDNVPASGKAPAKSVAG